MRDKPANLPASVAARLRNVAQAKNIGLDFILRRYAIERLLHRLSLSPFRDRFLLKGAMLFAAWLDDPFRPTQDLDLLGFGDPAVETIATTFKAICMQEANDDGMVFDAGGLLVDAIREEQQYSGVRVRTTAFLGTIRIPVQIDVGFGDAVTPAASEIKFPSLLDAGGPILLAYPPETVVAEKFQAIVSLGLANSRMKDFYDIIALGRLFPFSGAALASAIQATFNRRQTDVPVELPFAFQSSFYLDEQKNAQWKAFVGRTPLHIEVGDLQESVGEVASFVMPPSRAILGDTPIDMEWVPGGPWRQT
jgi:predicted nucleotidyltransferase component of viral defense system